MTPFVLRHARSLAGIGLSTVMVGCTAPSPHELYSEGAGDSECEQLLAGDEMAELTGAQSEFRAVEVDGLIACQALTSSETADRVSVIRVPAVAWAGAAESRLSYISGTTSDSSLASLVEKLHDGELTADDACKMFAREQQQLAGSAPGANLSVAESSRGQLHLLTAQSCAIGVYTLVEVESLSAWSDEVAAVKLLTAAIAELNPDSELTT